MFRLCCAPVSVLGSDLEPPEIKPMYPGLSPASPSAVLGRRIFRYRLKIKSITYT